MHHTLVMIILAASAIVPAGASETTFIGRIALDFEGAIFQPEGTKDWWRTAITDELISYSYKGGAFLEGTCLDAVVTGEVITDPEFGGSTKFINITQILSIEPYEGEAETCLESDG
jgi:hypothetical protein